MKMKMKEKEYRKGRKRKRKKEEKERKQEERRKRKKNKKKEKQEERKEGIDTYTNKFVMFPDEVLFLEQPYNIVDCRYGPQQARGQIVHQTYKL